MPDFEEKSTLFQARMIRSITAQLRMTMTNVFASADLLAPAEAREQDPKLDKNAAIHSMSCHQMLRLISNLSTAADLMEGGRFEPKNDDIAGLCRELCEKAEYLFEMKGVALECVCEPVSQVVAFDSALMERLVLNLLSNALKFTPAGGRVEVRVKSAKGRIILSVSDTGCGIPADRLDNIFDRFLDAGQIDAAPYGLGLGLFLCSLIARKHSGRIMAQSREGEGTTFTLSLPERKAPTAELHDLPFDYAGGFNHVLMELSDALPSGAFLQKYTD